MTDEHPPYEHYNGFIFKDNKGNIGWVAKPLFLAAIGAIFTFLFAHTA